MEGSTTTKAMKEIKEYLELRETCKEVLFKPSKDQAIFAKYLEFTATDLAKNFDKLFALLRTAPKDTRIAVFDVCNQIFEGKLLPFLFENSFCPPSPLSEKYSNVEINFANTGIKECGLRVSCDLQLKSKALLEEIALLQKLFGATTEDYLITISFDATHDPENATSIVKELVKAAMAFTLFHNLAYKITSCFDIKTDRADNKVILCIKVKPQFKVLLMDLHDLLRCLLPLEGEEESIRIDWEVEGDAVSLANSKEKIARVLMRNQIRYSAHVHTEHYKAIIKFIKAMATMKDSESLNASIVFGVISVLSGKATINYSRDDLKAQEEEVNPKKTFARALAELKEKEIVRKATGAVPVLKKLFDLFADYVENLDIALYIPGIRMKISGVLRNLGKLLTTLI